MGAAVDYLLDLRLRRRRVRVEARGRGRRSRTGIGGAGESGRICRRCTSGGGGAGAAEAGRLTVPALRLACEPLAALPARRGVRGGVFQERDRVAVSALADEDAGVPADARCHLLVRPVGGRRALVRDDVRAAGSEHAGHVRDAQAGGGLLERAAEAGAARGGDAGRADVRCVDVGILARFLGSGRDIRRKSRRRCCAGRGGGDAAGTWWRTSSADRGRRWPWPRRAAGASSVCDASPVAVHTTRSDCWRCATRAWPAQPRGVRAAGLGTTGRAAGEVALVERRGEV